MSAQFYFSDDSILAHYVLPLIKKYPEVLWFADNDVSVTKESGGGEQSKGWTQALAATKGENHPLIELPKSAGKYIELERMLSSIIFLNLFKDGSELAYAKLTSIQNSNDRLTFENFQWVHQLVTRFAATSELFDALEAMLVFSDAGKTPKAVKAAKEHGIAENDHDDFIDTLFHQKTDVLIKVLPSFNRLSDQNKTLLVNTVSAMQIHLGHVLHLEGGKGLFTKFVKSVNQGVINSNVLDFAFIVQLCDVAASAAHINHHGSLALIEDTFQGYRLVRETLEELLKGAKEEEAIAIYMQKRASFMKVELKDPEDYFLMRIACMMRLYKSEDFKILKRAVMEIDKAHLQIAMQQFQTVGGINAWDRNPTYVPAVAINVARFNDKNEERSHKLKRSLESLCCLALWFNTFGAKVSSLPYPISFNEMAGLASRNPALFSLKNFNPQDYELNDKNALIHKPKDTSAPPVTWLRDLSAGAGSSLQSDTGSVTSKADNKVRI